MICAGCQVRQECLEFALAHDQVYGIWGEPPLRTGSGTAAASGGAAAAAAKRTVAA